MDEKINLAYASFIARAEVHAILSQPLIMELLSCQKQIITF